MRGADDEFDQLAGIINRMLEQIQQLIEGVRNVSNAIAHDLRTPLAELRARLEDILRSKPDRELTLDSLGEAVRDRKSVVSGKSVSVRVDLGGRGIIKKKINI